MKASERGYATATVIGLMAVLSLGSSAILNAALTENQRAKRILQQVQMDALLEGELNRLIAEGLNTPAQFKLGMRSVEPSGVALIAEITDEQVRPDLLRDNKVQLRSIFEASSLTSTEQATLLQNKNEPGRLRHLEDLIPGADLSRETARCLEDKLTLYRSTLNPLSRPNPQSLDGAIIRFELKTDKETKPARRLRAIILFTGDRQTPYHIMDWRQDNDTQSPSCKTL
jgi:hypothetical protein